METKLRLDKYLWAIRIFKTRTQAADAIDRGHVKSNGANVKAAKQVSIGEQYEIKTEARKWIIQVADLLFERKQFAEAVKYYTDITPEEVLAKKSDSTFVDYTGKRNSKQGRPTKKNRRDMGNLL